MMLASLLDAETLKKLNDHNHSLVEDIATLRQVDRNVERSRRRQRIDRKRKKGFRVKA